MAHNPILDLLGGSLGQPFDPAGAVPQLQTPYDLLKPHERYLIDSFAAGAKKNLDTREMMRNASQGIGVEEGRAQALAPAQAVSEDGFVAQGLAEFLSSSQPSSGQSTGTGLPGVQTSPEGSSAGPNRSFDGTNGPGTAETSRGLSGGGAPTLSQFDQFMQFMQQRPKPPELAHLDSPSLLSTAIAVAVAAMSPPQFKSKILALPFQWEQAKQASENERRQIEFQDAVKSHDEALQEQFKLMDLQQREADRGQRAYDAEQNRQTQLGIAAGSQAGQTERTVLTQREISNRAFAGNAAKEKAAQLTNGRTLAQDVLKAGGDAAGREFAVQRYEQQYGPLDPDLRERLLNDAAFVQDMAQTKLKAEADRAVYFARSAGAQATVDERTVDDKVSKIENDLKLQGFGLKEASLDLAKLKFQVEHMDEEFVAKMAEVRARTADIKKRTANVGKPGTGARDKAVFKYDLDKAKEALSELKSQRKGLASDVKDAAAKYRDFADSKGEDHKDTKFYKKEWDDAKSALADADGQIAEAQKTVDDAFTATLPPDEPGIEPVHPRITGKIGK